MESLDFLEEYLEAKTIRLAEYQQKLARRYNRDVKTRGFSAGDLVLQKAVGNMQDMNAGKLTPSMGKALPSHCHRRCNSELFGGPRRETTSPTMECPQSEEILPLSIDTRGYMLNVMSYVHVVN